MGLIIGVGNTKPTFPYDYYYGIEWDNTVSNPKPSRIGKAELHASLPVQSMMRRCTLQDNGKVNYYLHANDSTKRDNGEAANLTGADGQIMVELPDCYARFEIAGNKRRALISTEPLPGFIKWNKAYISAYEATVQRSENKLASVMNTDADYRGGNNSPTNDADAMKSYLGRPATEISLKNFRAYARKRGSVEWNCYVYELHKRLYWFFAIEYCNFNSQAPFNAQLDSNGYHKGGLGDGVTTLYNKWGQFNGFNPFVPCGTTNSLGNHTGVVDYTLTAGSYDTNDFTVHVPSYRGIENPFGHISKLTDGCLCTIQNKEHGVLSKFYVCDDPARYSLSVTSYYNYRGDLPECDGFIKEMILGEYGEIMPLSCGGGDKKYFCDSYQTLDEDFPGEKTICVSFGGMACDTSEAGFVCTQTYFELSETSSDSGTRLCFFPQMNATH